MKYRPLCLTRSGAHTEPTFFTSVGPTGCQFTRSRECQMTRPGYASNDENVM